MNNLFNYIFTCLLLCISQITYAQDSYFFNQKNIISVHASFNPRLIPLGQNSMYGVGMYQNTGVGRGTYYQYYDESNKLMGGNQKFNVMFNGSYKRIYNDNRIVGVEFNYQKHNLTMNANANMGYQTNPNDPYSDILSQFNISTPVFNVYDLQFLWGTFSDATIAPNKHLFTYGLGVRMFSLDQDQNYRQDEDTPYTDLADYMDEYDKKYIYARLSMNYTYRILITKNLSLDLGVNFNLGLYQEMEPQDGLPMEYGFFTDEGPAYSRTFVKNQLGHETFFNMIYFRSGFSFAI